MGETTQPVAVKKTTPGLSSSWKRTPGSSEHVLSCFYIHFSRGSGSILKPLPRLSTTALRYHEERDTRGRPFAGSALLGIRIGVWRGMHRMASPRCCTRRETSADVGLACW